MSFRSGGAPPPEDISQYEDDLQALLDVSLSQELK